MKVLIISLMEGVPWGGSEELWSEAARVLLDRKCEVTLYLKEWPNEHPKVRALREKGANVRYRRAKRLVGKAFQKLTNRIYDPFISFLKSNRADVVLISQGANMCGPEWMEACSRVGLPYINIAQAALPWTWPDDQFASRLRKGYLEAKTACFVSAENLSLTERQIGANLKNARVVRNPFKVPYDASLPWPVGDIARWACVARLDTYLKGLDLLIEVMSWDKWKRRPLIATLYGSGPNERSLREVIVHRALKNIEFGGFVSEPADIWRLNHCLILPSRAEGLPLAIVEAMLCGRPCIVTNASGNAELLDHNVTGYIAENPTAKALDVAMEEAWQHRDSWETVGRSAAAAVRSAVPRNPADVFVTEVLGVSA